MTVPETAGFVPEQMKSIKDSNESQESKTRKDGRKKLFEIKTAFISGDKSEAKTLIDDFVERGFESQENQLFLRDSFNDIVFDGQEATVLEMIAKRNKAGLKKIMEDGLQGHILKD